LRSGQCSNF
jgi:hypothetical protein